MGFLSRYQDVLKSVLRIVAGFLYFSHGAQKLFGAFGGLGPNGGAVDSWFSFPMGIAGILETFGGILLILGLFTRPTALILAGQMAVAYFMVHAPQGGAPIQNGGELAALYCFLWLFFAASGPGAWSLDRVMKRDAAPVAGAQDREAAAA